MKRIRGLRPKSQIDGTTKIVILGSFPGEESLKKRQYYANKRNKFWEIIFQVLSKPVPEGYNDKIAFLRKRGIALWDVIEACCRKGSLDSRIIDPKLNKIDKKVSKYPKMKAIFLNGKKAEKLFMKEFTTLPKCVHVETLPSTSPANARISYNQKIRRWKSILKFSKF